MKIEMTTAVAGVGRVGDVVEVEEALGKSLVKGGHAKPPKGSVQSSDDTPKIGDVRPSVAGPASTSMNVPTTDTTAV